MIAVSMYLNDRKDELVQHAELIRRLEEANLDKANVQTALSVPQIQLSILRSGLMIHLYNVVEAIMTRLLEELGAEVEKYGPSEYAEKILSAWVESSIKPYDGAGPEKLLKRMEEVVQQLINPADWDRIEVKRSAGNWDDQSIRRVSERLGIDLRIDNGLRRRACGHYYDDISRLGYVRKRRNELSHEVLTFAEAARDRTCEELDDLVSVVSDYLERVVECFDDFLKSFRFLRSS